MREKKIRKTDKERKRKRHKDVERDRPKISFDRSLFLSCLSMCVCRTKMFTVSKYMCLHQLSYILPNQFSVTKGNI